MQLRIHRTLIAIVLMTLVATAAASTSRPAPRPAVELSYVAHHDHEPPSTTTSAATTTTVAPTTTTTETATTTTAEEATTTVEPETTVTTRARRTTTVSPTVAPVVDTTVVETTVPETAAPEPVVAPDPGDGSPCRTGPSFDAHACELIEYRGDFTPEEVQALVARAFPGEERKALSVAACETGRTWNRFVHNPSGARGIMQVMSSWKVRFAEITGLPYYDDVFEVGPNLVFSVWLRHEPGSGWGNWSCR